MKLPLLTGEEIIKDGKDIKKWLNSVKEYPSKI